MRKIIFRWLGISFGVSLIPVILLGASQGGIALSPFILIVGIVIGFTGAGIHSSIYAFKEGNKKKWIISLFFSVFALYFAGSTLYSLSRCTHDSETKFAQDRVVKYINSKDDLNLSYLGAQIFSEKSCQFTFEYTDPNNKFVFIVGEFGKLHFDRE